MNIKNGIYQRRNSGAVGSSSVVTKISVKNEVITDAWYDVPGGEYRGSDPVDYIGLDATDVINNEPSIWTWFKVG